MKSYFLLAFVLIILSISGCTQFELACPQDLKTCPDGTQAGRDPALNCDFRSCPQVKEKEPVEIILSDYDLYVKECYVTATVPDVWYVLEIVFVDRSGSKRISFSVQDPENKASNLLTLGLHPATGNAWDKISNHLGVPEEGHSSSSPPIESDEMEIVWESIDESFEGTGRIENGNGYIEIKKRIDVDFPTIDPYYYPPQTIYFDCNKI